MGKPFSAHRKEHPEKQNLDSMIRQRENAKAELGKPFAMEAKLKEKNKRLAELNALLNLDDKETVLLEENEFCEKSPVIERINRKKTEYER